MAKFSKDLGRQRRHKRIRKNMSGTAEKPRLCVFRSNSYIYGQVIDDVQGVTLVSASSIEPEMKSKLDGKNNKATAEEVGTLIAKRALEKGIEEIVFDRGGFIYHGRIKAFADAARAAGLKF